VANQEFPTDEEIKAWERSVKVRKWILVGGLISIPVLIILAVIIANTKREPTFPVTDIRSQPTATSPQLSPPQRNESGEKAEYSGYQYSFKKEGGKTVALFFPKFLPRDDKIFIGATLDVIKRSYQDAANSDAQLVDSPPDGASARMIRFESKKNGYLVLPVKEDTGEIHSLVITQVPVK